MDQYELITGDAEEALQHLEKQDLNDVNVMNKYVNLVHTVMEDIDDAIHFFVHISNKQFLAKATPKYQELLNLREALHKILSKDSPDSSSIQEVSVSFQAWMNDRTS